MSDSSLNVRWRAISELQRLQERFRPGTPRADDAEHATTLALSADRPAVNSTYLMYDALRDARRIRSRRRPIVSLSSLEAATAADAYSGAIDFSADRYRRRHHQPDQLAEARDLEAALRERLAATPNAQECLDALLDGETATSTAQRLGLPRQRVSQLRATIRRIALWLVTDTQDEVAA